jgi:asparagine synthase (glutamine-hydrolysing)
MCGIAGFYNAHFLSPVDLKRMTRALAHRGPDGEGFYLKNDKGVGLGHRRLAIVDLSDGGKQPMTYQDSGIWVTFNGEIYNY